MINTATSQRQNLWCLAHRLSVDDLGGGGDVKRQMQIHDSTHEHAGDLGPVRGVTTATKAYPEAPYSERSYSYLYLQLLNIYVIR